MKVELLPEEERERIKVICQRLFHENYLLEYRFSAANGMKKADPDYLFAWQRREELSELLEQCGWQLRVDNREGVLYLISDYPGAYVPLKKLESQCLFVLYLLYDERRMQESGTAEVWCSVRDVMEKLTTLNIVKSVPKQERAAVLRTLEEKRLVDKPAGQWGDLETRFLILPSILCTLSQEKIAALRRHYSEEPEESIDMAEEGEDTE